ncbi:MAG: VOC family protein [Phycisphaerae bacterium]
MPQRLARFALVVRDYDDAIAFYCNTLGFELLEDTDLGSGKRWVRVAPRGSTGAEILLARAVTDEQRSRIGNQAGGRVFLFLETDDFRRDYDALLARGVEFVRPPEEASYGTVAVFLDLYGNKIDLIQPRGFTS